MINTFCKILGFIIHVAAAVLCFMDAFGLGEIQMEWMVAGAGWSVASLHYCTSYFIS